MIGNDTNEKLAEYFYKLGQKVHIELTNNSFYNGTIHEISSDFLLLDDQVVGEIPIFYVQITKFEPFVERK